MVGFSERVEKRFAALFAVATVTAVALACVLVLPGCVVDNGPPSQGYQLPQGPQGPQGPQVQPQPPSDVHPLDRYPVRPNHASQPSLPGQPGQPVTPSPSQAAYDYSQLPQGPDQPSIDPSGLVQPWLGSNVLIGAFSDVQMDLPPDLRTKNWGGGSCVHASTVNLLYWQGQEEMAEWWRRTYIGGEYADRLIKRLENAGLRYAYTDKGDFEFLKWCCRTRRGAGIFYKPSHAINCVGIDQNYVYLLDNNYTSYPEQKGHYERVPVQQFVSAWKGYGGFAWSLVYAPPPPNPFVSSDGSIRGLEDRP